MERWRNIEESCHGIKEAFDSFSNCVLALPDISALGSILAVDKMIKGEMKTSDGLPKRFDHLEMGEIVNELENRGVFIPNNFNLLEKDLYLLYLRVCGIPVPRFEILDSEDGKLTKDQIRHLSENDDSNFPPLFVVKPSRGHRGEDIKVVSKKELTTVCGEKGGIIVQRFWWPWRKSGQVQDARVVTINGEPRDFCVRQAKEQLIDPKSGRLIEYPPSLSRVLANIAQGGTVAEVPRRLQGKLFNLARETCSVIREHALWVRENNMKVDNPQEVNLGLMSVDILLGEEGLAVCEVDTFPGLSFFPNLDRLGKAYVDYLKNQTQQGERPVLLFQGVLGSGLNMPIPLDVLERFLKQENVPYVIAEVESG
jgi:glutathione synthase/RimK-type ligase-like ATP-grasp enzyme